MRRQWLKLADGATGWATAVICACGAQTRVEGAGQEPGDRVPVTCIGGCGARLAVVVPPRQAWS